MSLTIEERDGLGSLQTNVPCSMRIVNGIVELSEYRACVRTLGFFRCALTTFGGSVDMFHIRLKSSNMQNAASENQAY